MKSMDAQIGLIKQMASAIKAHIKPMQKTAEKGKATRRPRTEPSWNAEDPTVIFGEDEYINEGASVNDLSMTTYDANAIEP